MINLKEDVMLMTTLVYCLMPYESFYFFILAVTEECFNSSYYDFSPDSQ